MLQNWKKHLCLLLISLLFLFAGVTTSEGQGLDGVRKGIYKAKRELMREANRGRRDANQVNRLFSKKKRDVDPAADTTEYIKWSMEPHVPNSGMIRDYEYVYTFLHANQEWTFRKDPDLRSIQWDSVNNKFYKNIGAGQKLRKGVEVMGWHPYWMGDSYKSYRYKMLSIVSFYSYDVNPNTGGPSNPEILDSLRVSQLPDSAAKYGTKLFLSVTSFGYKNNHKFLGDEQSKEIFITEILNLLNSRKDVFAGVDINFEQIDTADSQRFTDFIKQLSSRLGNANYKVILDVPYFNDKNVFDYSSLASHVMYFNIMGYDFSGEYSAYPGSISPINSLETQPSLETAVNDLLNIGILGKQIILTLPLYGVTWDVTQLEKGGGSSYEASLPYYMIQSKYGSSYNPFYDALSGSFFYLLEENAQRKMCWFENDVSLDLKFKWAQSKNLKGIGFWALGYDQNSDEIWDVVQDNYGAELIQIEPVETSLSGPFGLALEIVEHKSIIGLGMLVLAAFMALGFSLSLRDWRVRDVLFKKQSFRFIYAALFILISIVGIQWWWNNDKGWGIAAGLIVGAVGVTIINVIFNRYRNDLR